MAHVIDRPRLWRFNACNRFHTFTASAAVRIASKNQLRYTERGNVPIQIEDGTTR